MKEKNLCDIAIRGKPGGKKKDLRKGFFIPGIPSLQPHFPPFSLMSSILSFGENEQIVSFQRVREGNFVFLSLRAHNLSLLFEAISPLSESNSAEKILFHIVFEVSLTSYGYYLV